MIRWIAGDSSLPLRHLILNLVVFVALIAGSYFFVSDALLGLGWMNLVFDLVLTGAFVVLYWLTRHRGKYRDVAHIAAIAGLIFFCINYFVNGGLAGPTAFAVLMLLTFITILHSPRASLRYLILGSLLMFGCFAIDYLNPGLVTPYPTRDLNFLDVAATFFLCLLLLAFVMRMMMRFFQESLERSRAEQAALLQSEKMASLGEIAANISHEISTPIGVIGSSLSASQDWWHQQLPLAPAYWQALEADQVQTFLELLAQGRASSRPAPDSRSLRSQRQVLLAQMQAAGLEDGEVLAEELVALGWSDWDPRFDPLLRDAAGRDALSFLLKTLTLERANRNAAVAYERIRGLLEALVSYSRSEVPDAEPLLAQVEDGLDTVLMLYSTAHKLTVEVVRRYSPVPPVLAKADELIQVWTNLVQNALQAMEYRGVLTVAVDKVGSWVRVAISDTGTGVPAALREKIFTPFFTTKERGVGTGLGLGIVGRIVAAHGGQVEVTEAADGGACFVVRLPIPTSVGR
ncbi:MAG: ATP-binding protein [Spirochaetales bacterium]